MELVNIGNITNTRGVSGALNIVSCPSGIIIDKGSTVFIGYSENYVDKYLLAEEFIAISSKSELHLLGIDNKEQAQSLKEKSVFAYKEDILANNNGYIFADDIVGCKVIDMDNNTIIGDVVEIWELPANNVWLVKTDDGHLPLPVIDDVIVEIDINIKQIKVHIIDGLLDIKMQ